LTFGQFQQLLFRQKLDIYIKRYDLSSIYALVYNISQTKKISITEVLGEHPSVDYEPPKKPSGASILQSFQSILPPEKRARNIKKKKK